MANRMDPDPEFPRPVLEASRRMAEEDTRRTFTARDDGGPSEAQKTYTLAYMTTARALENGKSRDDIRAEMEHAYANLGVPLAASLTEQVRVTMTRGMEDALAGLEQRDAAAWYEAEHGTRGPGPSDQ